MGDVTFITRDVRDYDAKDAEEGKATKTKLHPQISIPDKDKDGKSRGRLKLEFSLNSFKQLVTSQLGIPYQYVLKCPASLARDNIRHWQGAFADRDLLIRIRQGGEVKDPYARAVLAASYGRLDNTQLLKLLGPIAKEAGMKVWRFDMPDNAFFLKCLLPDHVNMGTKADADPVHLGFSLGNSETGNRAVSWDIMTFRLVCTNGMISLVDGERLIRMQHKGDIDIKKLETKFREKIHETCMKQESIFGKFRATKDHGLPDVFEETRALWDRFRLRKENRNMVFQLLTETYTGGTRWDVVNAITQSAQNLADNPVERVKMEEAAGQYLLMDGPLLALA